MESVWRVACVRIPRFPIGAVWQEQRKRAEGSEQQGVATKSMIGTQIPLPFPLQTRDNIHAPERDGVRNPISDARNGTQSGSRTTDPRQSTPNPQSPLRSPQSAIRNPQSLLRNPQSAILRPQSAIRNPQPAPPPAWDDLPVGIMYSQRLRTVSKGASRRRVRAGMTAAEARALCADLEIADWDVDVIARTVDLVTAELLEASPQVTPAAGKPGTWWVGASGFESIGGEQELLQSLLGIAGRWHPDSRAAVASSCVAAYAGTWGQVPPAGLISGHKVEKRKRSEEKYPVIVPLDGDAAYLAAAPLGLIPMEEELREPLRSLGITTAGSFAALEPADVERRWGDTGLLAWRLARGEDQRRPVLARAERERRVEVELATPASTLEPALFLVQGALGRLVRDLAADGRSAAAIAITLTLDDARSALPTGARAHTVTREVRLSRPVARVEPLMEHCRALLDRWTLTAPLCGVAVSIVATATASGEQGNLLDTSWRDAGAAEAALARLRSELGTDSVVRPVARDEHRPERAGEWVDDRRVRGEGSGVEKKQNAETNLKSGFSRSPRNTDSHSPTPHSMPKAALRLLENPEAVDVEYSAGLPAAMWWRGSRVAIARAVGPERLTGDWWKDGYERDYWRCEGESGDWMLFSDAAGGQKWYLQGWYD